jgi:hypothetical protein
VPPGCVAIFNGGLSAVGEWRIELGADVASLPESVALSALINSYIENRKDDVEGARREILAVTIDAIDRTTNCDGSARDEAKSLVRGMIYGDSVN